MEEWGAASAIKEIDEDDEVAMEIELKKGENLTKLKTVNTLKKENNVF